MPAKGAMTGGASVANSRERLRYSVSDSAMRMVQEFATWWHQAAGCEPVLSPVTESVAVNQGQHSNLGFATANIGIDSTEK
jgi:hypothetical protein